LPASKKTKTGYSTGADVLEKLAPYHEIVEKILVFRQLGKLQSTYVEGLLKVIRPETKRVHTRFRQAVTATGRLSSIEPNLQNIPIRLEAGRKLRLAFEPSYEDWVILAADYSQIELRILAHLSGDEALIEAFRQGVDVHTSTAANVFNVALEDVTPLMRRQAKAVNFGIVYGISDYGLSQNLNITRNQAAQFIADYFIKFPGVQQYMTDIVEVARKQGYVTTLLNRRRYLPDIHSRNFNLRSFAERTAMNTPIQGTAADIIKRAMVRMDEALRNSDLKARMLLQVHDELIFECPAAEAEALRTMVEDSMENALTLNVPLRVDIHSGQTWYDAK
jgi:DNA polymerase-1